MMTKENLRWRGRVWGSDIWAEETALSTVFLLSRLKVPWEDGRQKGETCRWFPGKRIGKTPPVTLPQPRVSEDAQSWFCREKGWTQLWSNWGPRSPLSFSEGSYWGLCTLTGWIPAIVTTRKRGLGMKPHRCIWTKTASSILGKHKALLLSCPSLIISDNLIRAGRQSISEDLSPWW